LGIGSPRRPPGRAGNPIALRPLPVGPLLGTSPTPLPQSTALCGAVPRGSRVPPAPHPTSGGIPAGKKGWQTRIPRRTQAPVPPPRAQSPTKPRRGRTALGVQRRGRPTTVYVAGPHQRRRPPRGSPSPAAAHPPPHGAARRHRRVHASTGAAATAIADGSAGGGNIRHAGVTTRATGVTTRARLGCGAHHGAPRSGILVRDDTAKDGASSRE